MKAIYFHTAGAIALTFGLAACIPASQAPAPTPPPVVTPAPTPTPTPVVQQPRYDNWMDAPRTPGDWSYMAESGETFAIYQNGSAAPLAMIRCDLRSKRVAIGRFGAARASTTIAVKTETRAGALNATPRESVQPLMAAELDANDPLLDAMALSKGRFAMEVAGQRTLYLPSWAEVTRVIEDCR